VIVTNGIHAGVSSEAYHAAPGLSRSRLKALLTGPPLDFHAPIPDVDSYAKRKGTAGHLAVLEPERFATEVVSRVKFTGKGSVKLNDEWEEAQAGKIILSPDDHANLAAVAKMVRAKKGPAMALREGGAELSLWWDHGGLLLKSRPDFLSVERGIGVDLKFTDKPLNDRTIVAFMEDYFVAMQCSMLTAGVHALTGKWIATYLLVVHADPPTDMRLVLVGDLNGEPSDLDWLERGDAQLAEALRIYTECMASGLWHGWCDAGVTRVPAPAWVKSRTDELTKSLQESASHD
jgi:hypothetical protein